MNEQANEALANLLELAIDGVEGAVEFSKAQIPDVVEQLLMWQMLESLIFFTFSVTSLVFLGIYWWKVIPIIKEEIKRDFLQQRDSRTFVPAMVGVLLTCCTALFSSIMFTIEWLKILVAPKLYLLEYAAELVK